MPLFRVKVECEFVVLAEDTDEAWGVALSSVGDDGIEYDVSENSKIFTKHDLPSDWDERCLPYVCGGTSNDKTIAEHLAEQNKGVDDGTIKSS
jgi:hypothetical protein